MKTPEELREWAETLGQSILNHLERETDYEYQGGDCMIAANPIIEALAQIQRETAEECVRIAATHERETLTEVAHPEPHSCEHPVCCEQRSMSKTARQIKQDICGKFDLCNRCDKPKGSAEGCCGCGR